jgi:hypothetical protein
MNMSDISDGTDQQIDQSETMESITESTMESTMESTSELKLSTLTLSQYHQAIIDGYKNDVLFSKVQTTGIESDIYEVKDGLLYLCFGGLDRRLCIPNIKVKGGREKATDKSTTRDKAMEKGEKHGNLHEMKSLREMLILHAHQIGGHKDTRKTDGILRRYYYWKTMIEDIGKYVRSCHSYQTKKTFPSK